MRTRAQLHPVATTVVLHRARSFVRRDGRRPGRGRAGRRAAGAGYVPATAAQFNRRWRRFGKYGEMKRHELLRAAEAKRPLPVAELQRKSALSMREEAALLDFRRHLRLLGFASDLFCANFIPGYQRGFGIGGKNCLPPCTHKFGVVGGTASEHQVHIRMVRLPIRFESGSFC